MKKILLLPLLLLPACTALVIYGYKNPDDSLWAWCTLEKNFFDLNPEMSDVCYIQKQEEAVSKLQKNLSKHTNQLNEYNNEYGCYLPQLKAELSSGAPLRTVNDIEQYLYQSKRARDMFTRLVFLDSILIPSTKSTISSNIRITLDLEQSIWLLKQKQLYPEFNVSEKDINSMEYLIQSGSARSRNKIRAVGGINIPESKKKILNEVIASLES